MLLAPGRKLLEADAALKGRFEAWSAEQCYERFCNLYVGLTRAKHATYVLLPKAPANPSSERRFDLWIRSVMAGPAGERVWNGKARATLHEAGDADWYDKVRGRTQAPESSGQAPSLGLAVPRMSRTSPSSSKKSSGKIAHSPSGMAFGREVHAIFESIGWIDEERVDLPEGEAGELVSGLLEQAGFVELFSRRGRVADLFREQAVETVLEGRWLSGVMDRLHVFRDPAGRVSGLELIDFKTDAVVEPEELIERYTGQMQAYRSALSLMHPGVEVRCLLVSTRLRKVIECP